MATNTNTTENPLTRLLTADDVAAAYRIPKEQVWALTRAGKLPTVKLGRRTYRYHPERVERAILELED